MFEISFSPADGSGKLTTEVFEFTGTGGVTMGMYNTDEVSRYIQRLDWSPSYMYDVGPHPPFQCSRLNAQQK